MHAWTSKVTIFNPQNTNIIAFLTTRTNAGSYSLMKNSRWNLKLIKPTCISILYSTGSFTRELFQRSPPPPFSSQKADVMTRAQFFVTRIHIKKSTSTYHLPQRTQRSCSYFFSFFFKGKKSATKPLLLIFAGWRYADGSTKTAVLERTRDSSLAYAIHRLYYSSWA